MISTPTEAFEVLASLPGCDRLSLDEVESWERANDINAGRTFRQLLTTVGCDASWLFPNGFSRLADLPALRQDANEILSDSGSDLRLGATDVVLDFFGGEGFSYFRCVEDDPEVFKFFEWEPKPSPAGVRLGLYVVQALNTYLQRA